MPAKVARSQEESLGRRRPLKAAGRPKKPVKVTEGIVDRKKCHQEARPQLVGRKKCRQRARPQLISQGSHGLRGGWGKDWPSRLVAEVMVGEVAGEVGSFGEGWGSQGW